MDRPATLITSLCSRELVIAAIALVATALHLVLRFVFKIEDTVLGITWPAIPLLVALVVGGIPLVVGSGDPTGAIGVQFRPSRRHFHRHGCGARRVPRRHARGAHAVWRTGSGSLRRAPGVLRTARPRPTDALASTPQAGWNGQRDPAGRDRGRRPARRLPTRDLSGRCRRGGRAQHDGRILPHRRTVSFVQGRGVGCDVRGHQRRRRADDPCGKNGGRFAVCQDHAGHARVGTAAARVAATRRPDWCHLHAAGSGHRPGRLGRECDALRFLAVLVVATPCPLLIGIPVAIIGSVSLAARRGIIIKDPAVLEKIDTCRTAIFDKTGTLTYGQPKLTDVLPGEGFTEDEALAVVASLERYSRHPLAAATIAAADQAGLELAEAAEVNERPGEGLGGIVSGREVQVTSRKEFLAQSPASAPLLPPSAGGLECVALIDGTYAATIRYRDEPRAEGKAFIRHLKPHHGLERVLLVSGDRESEVRYLAEKVGDHRGLRQPNPRTEASARARGDQKGRHRFHGRRHQRRPGTDRCNGRHRLRPGQ